ncbi:MAG TPA: OmpH family outer membrane protein [Gemmatimonadales bacterium]
MLRALGAAALLLVATVSGRAQSPCATSKVAFLNGAQILASMPEYVAADSQLRLEEHGYQLEISKQSSALDSIGLALQDKAALMSAAQKATESKRFREKQDSLQQHVNDLQQRAGQRRQQVLQPIESRVTDVIDGMRAELQCAIIFDVSNQAAGIASADKTLDLTSRVIDRLKATSPAAPPPKKPPEGTNVPEDQS